MLLSKSVNMSGKSLVKSSHLFSKFAYYRHKYGIVHAICSYIGRQNIFIWKLIGSVTTHSYLRKYLESHEYRIINLGGGSNCLENCLTVDINPRSDAYVDITRKLPFSDCSIDAIFCEEVIEHIDLELGVFLLSECWRILKLSGIIRITTPNLNWFTEQVAQSIAANDEINKVFYCHGHRYLYTQQALDFYCKQVGFINLKPSSYQDITSKLGYLDSHADRFNHPPEISQYVEMHKQSVLIERK